MSLDTFSMADVADMIETLCTAQVLLSFNFIDFIVVFSLFFF